MLSPEFSARFEESGKTLLHARPFRHAVIDNFFDTSFCQRLIDEFPLFDALMRDPAFLERVGETTGIPDLLYDPDYVGGGTHENLDGQELDVHVDFNYHPKTFQHRRLNPIVFLNREWEAAWGGSLELCSDPWNPDGEDTVRVLPLANRAVLFETTEHSWHGFSRITLPQDRKELSRRSIAVYLYTKARAAEETAESHGTVYIPRPLPAYVVAGTYASEGRSDSLPLSTGASVHEAKAGLTSSASSRIGRVVTWPLRVFTQGSEKKNASHVLYIV